jgi:hypothetical protein
MMLNVFIPAHLLVPEGTPWKTRGFARRVGNREDVLERELSTVRQYFGCSWSVLTKALVFAGQALMSWNDEFFTDGVCCV